MPCYVELCLSWLWLRHWCIFNTFIFNTGYGVIWFFSMFFSVLHFLALTPYELKSKNTKAHSYLPTCLFWYCFFFILLPIGVLKWTWAWGYERKVKRRWIWFQNTWEICIILHRAIISLRTSWSCMESRDLLI